jgi:outer membrane protein OmpA-like peptidoglycan-associated protein
VRNIAEINSPYWDSHPCISSDGTTLYFASDRPGGYGKVDIYVARFRGGRWTEPENAGPGINTEFDDMCPTIAPDTRTFYFASNRPGGMGGFDLYTTKLTGGQFGRPRNMGEPINSAYDDYFYQALNSAERAYFSSNRPGGSGGIDIYVVTPNPFPSEPVVSVHGTVSDALSHAPLGSTIIITDLKTNQQVAELRSDDVTGEYYCTLVAGHIYSITSQKSGYLFYSERYEVPPTTAGEDIEKGIELGPLAGGSTRLMVFFDFDKAELLGESTSELERLAEFLKWNGTMKISLEGHTDDVGSDEYNDALSLRRASAVKDYLVNAGINGSRIATVGLGKRQPLVRATTDEARRSNRRVEMKVVG